MDEIDHVFSLVVGAIVAVASAFASALSLLVAGITISVEAILVAIATGLFIGGATGFVLFLRARRYWKSLEGGEN